MGFDGRTVVLTQRSLFRNTVTRQVRIQIEDVTTIRFIKSAKRRLGALGNETEYLRSPRATAGKHPGRRHLPRGGGTATGRVRSVAAEVASPDFTDIDLGIVSQPHQASEKLRRMDIGNALFVRLRRFLGRLADEGLLTDLSG